VGRTERRLVLARLIEAWAHTPQGSAVLATPPNAAEILALADSLAELVDDLAIEGIRYEALRDLPPENLDAHWQKVTAFLDVAFRTWPAVLAERGRADAAALRNERLRRQAAAAPLLFGARPVVAAGSTGSIPATAELLKAIALLPRGALVLPGVDTSMTPTQHAVLLHKDSNAQSHPQYGLARLLRRLGAGPGEVIELAGPEASRTRTVARALALADDTRDWAASRADAALDVAAAARGLAVIAARNADEEARAIAICAREALAAGRTVGIVSPDQNLSRRIGAELLRFGVTIDDPAGTPLFQSRAGRLVRILLALVRDGFGAVDLVALLRHRAVTLGLARGTVLRLVERIELRLLRGERLRPGLDGLRRAIDDSAAPGRNGKPKLDADERAAAHDLLDRLQAAVEPLAAAPKTAAALAAALDSALTAVLAPAPGQTAPLLAGRDELTRWAADVGTWVGQGPALPADGPLDSVLYELMRDVVVRPAADSRDDIAIWGLLEARLQSRDRMILAGLNDDIWPAVADSGPWLSRGMRLELGLEAPERRQGQAAHDFAMAAGNDEVVLAFAARLGTAPALPSRLVQRLEAFLGHEVASTLRAAGNRWLDAARRLDATGLPLQRAERPAPRPPATARAQQLSITEIETLIRSPYDIYVRHTLNLRKLAPLGEAPDARDRGNIVHDIFATFVTTHDIAAPDALDRLKALAVEAFGRLDAIAERRDIWLHRFGVAAAQFLAFERARDSRIIRRHAEIEGRWELPGGFVLTGRADRVDVLDDGTVEILDFKTGGIPDPGDMKSFLAPQLPLEAAMLAAGGLAGVAPAAPSAFTYIKIGLGPEAFAPKPYRMPEGYTLTDVVAEMEQRLANHVDLLLRRDDLPMLPLVFPRPDGRVRFAGDTDHLMRMDEWHVNEGDESE
jgi:ATP-dependent helicase/nuclease subunit B